MCDDPDSTSLSVAGADAIDDMCERVALIFNGDLRLPYPVHITTAATQKYTRSELVDLAVDAAVRACLIPGLTSALPSKNRWGSMMTALERQAGGFFIHNLASAVAQMTFAKWKDADVGEDEENDLRLEYMKKGWRVRCYTADAQRRRRACLCLFVSLPLDHLWRHIQYAEAHGAALQDLCIPHANCFRRALNSFWTMVASPVSEGPLAVLAHQYGHEEGGGLIKDLRWLIVHKAAHLWYRLIVPLSGFPFRLCGLVDERLSGLERRKIAEEFFETPECCLDPDFSLKVCSTFTLPFWHFFPRTLCLSFSHFRWAWVELGK